MRLRVVINTLLGRDHPHLPLHGHIFKILDGEANGAGGIIPTVLWTEEKTPSPVNPMCPYPSIELDSQAMVKGG